MLSAFLDERLRRLVAAAESVTLGYGGVSKVSRVTGVSRRAITQGVKELRHPLPGAKAARGPRIRSPGGGRKKILETDPALAADLERLVEPVTRCDPEWPLRWTCKSVRPVGSRIEAARAGRQPSDGGRPAAGLGVQLASES
jgi:hypothetical protein